MEGMRKLFLSTFIAMGLTLIGVGSFAEEGAEQAPAEAVESVPIKGDITSIQGNALTIKDEAGQEHQFILNDPKTLEGLKVGDSVNVNMQEGATSVEKLETEAPAGNEAPPAGSEVQGEAPAPPEAPAENAPAPQ